MRRALAPLLLIGLALMLRSACDDRVAVEGTLRDLEGQPVAGGVVTARYKRRMNEETKRVSAEQDGTFRLSLSVPSTRLPVPVTVQAPGFMSAYLAVPTNQHNRLEVVLAPLGSDARSSFTLEAE